jgi:S1-C subfamily serine protease
MYIPFDMRPNTAFINDTVVATAYPAEIFTPAQMKSGLYTISSRNMVRELYTFDLVHADAFAMGTSLLAEGGSSGGAVVNAWGYLVGVITSVSQAAIADRDLRAIAISYIDRDITTTISMHIADIVQNRESMRTTFERDTLPRILDTYIKVLSGK